MTRSHVNSGTGDQNPSGLVSARIRDRMVERVRELGVRDARVLESLRIVPRHLFVDEALASRAYEDTALPIGHGQTISQPYIVARTAELALDRTCPTRAPRACSRSVPAAVMRLRYLRNYSVKSSASSVYVRCMNVRAKTCGRCACPMCG